MTKQRIVESLIQLGYSNQEIVKELKIAKSTVRQMRYRFNKKVAQDKAITIALSLPQTAKELERIEENVIAQTTSLAKEDISKLKEALQKSVLKAYTCVNLEVARRAETKAMSDEALAVVYRGQLDLFK